jgi:hypothetical protein
MFKGQGLNCTFAIHLHCVNRIIWELCLIETKLGKLVYPKEVILRSQSGLIRNLWYCCLISWIDFYNAIKITWYISTYVYIFFSFLYHRGGDGGIHASQTFLSSTLLELWTVCFFSSLGLSIWADVYVTITPNEINLIYTTSVLEIVLRAWNYRLLMKIQNVECTPLPITGTKNRG